MPLQGFNSGGVKTVVQNNDENKSPAAAGNRRKLQLARTAIISALLESPKKEIHPPVAASPPLKEKKPGRRKNPSLSLFLCFSAYRNPGADYETLLSFSLSLPPSARLDKTP